MYTVFCFSNNHEVRLLLCGGVPSINQGPVLYPLASIADVRRHGARIGQRSVPLKR